MKSEVGRRRWWQGLWLACLLPMVMSPALAQTQVPAQGIDVQDDRGVQHHLEAPAQRIVSLLPSLTEVVAALGATQRLVGVDRYSNWPAEVARLPRLGGLDDTPLEAVVRLRPDVVLASTSARSLDRLEALGIRVVRLKSDRHEDVHRAMLVVAQLLGQPQSGEQLWVQQEAAVARAAARVPAVLRGQRVYFELDGGPYAAGTSSFIGQTLARLGLDNVVPAALGPFPRLNPEFVLQADPDLVIGLATVQAARLARPGWQQLRAVRRGQVCTFSDAHYELLTRPGPRLGEAAGVLADCLQRLGRHSATP